MTETHPHIAGIRAIVAILFMTLAIGLSAQPPEKGDSVAATPVRKVLFIGDSMTGWLAERLNAYGRHNGFDVATVVWDGSTIAKWAHSPRLSQIISEQKPDAIFVCLGMNEMLERNPEKRLSAPLDRLTETFGDTPFLWIGPPVWPGHPGEGPFNDWMEQELGQDRYFRSSGLEIKRQSKSNPHPSRKGIEDWMDKVVEWIGTDSGLDIETSATPAPGEASRGKTFIYKKMKDKL